MAANDTEYCETKITQALKHLWLAQVTDTTGVNPGTIEFKYGIDNTLIAQTLIDEAIALMRDRISAWQSKIQIDAYGRNVFTNELNFMNLTTGSSFTQQALEDKFGFDLKVDYQYEDLHPHNESYHSKSLSIVIKGQQKQFDFDIAYFEFAGPYMVHVNNTQPYESFGPLEGAQNYTAGFIADENEGGRSNHNIEFVDNWEKAVYSPSMGENYTAEITRSEDRKSVV